MTLPDWLEDDPGARHAFDRARVLGRRAVEESGLAGLNKHSGSSELQLAKWRRKLGTLKLDPAQLVRLRRAIDEGEALGRSEGDGTRRERTCFPNAE